MFLGWLTVSSEVITGTDFADASEFAAVVAAADDDIASIADDDAGAFVAAAETGPAALMHVISFALRAAAAS